MNPDQPTSPLPTRHSLAPDGVGVSLATFSWPHLAAGEALAASLSQGVDAIGKRAGSGFNSGSFLDFGNQRRADDGRIGETTKDRDVAGERNAKADSNRKMRKFADTAQ